MSAHTEVEYDEKLHVPLRWWVQATMFLASVWLAFVVALPAPVAWGATGFLALLVGTFFLTYGAARLRVHDHTFRAGRATIGLHLLADPEPLDVEATRLTAGRYANGRAYHLLRPYLKRSVKVRVADPTDPVPYWLVSTRDPVSLARALARGSAPAGQG